METYPRSEQTKFFPQGGEIQNGDTGNHQNIPPARGVGYLNRLQGRLLPYPYTGTVQEISEISCPGSNIPIQSTALWSVHSTLGVHCSGKGGETDGNTQGYKDPPVPDGYRSAIADKLGNSTLNISKDENLTRLLDSFHRDGPKGRRGIPSWKLSLVLHQLTKAPFEPIKEASLKHLTFKTVFLLALGSGKCRSEIDASQNRNIRHQSDWSRVSLYPSPSFLSKNQLAKEDPDSVAPVVIPALAPTLDRSLKSDRSLCPVRALCYYLDRTSDLRQNKELVFVSFKKGFDKDISPATISSWIKQMVIPCYELSDQEAHTLHQVKAHDVRAFAASKAFQSGVSLEQILSACHWKSHNTFRQFYLKDVAWADSELYHLGPVVAAQKIHK